MGTFNTLLQIANFGMELGQYAELQKLRDQQAAMALEQLATNVRAAIIESARQELFRLKQFADNALLVAHSRPVIGAGAFKLLSMQLENMSLTPDMFLDLRDKDYCAKVLRSIRLNLVRLYKGLTPEESERATSAAMSALQLPNYTYYVEHGADMEMYRNAQDFLAAVERARQGKALSPATITGLGWIGLAVLVIWGFGSGSAGWAILAFLGAGGIGYAMYGVSQTESERRRSVERAKTTMAQIEGRVDLDQFERARLAVGLALPEAQMRKEAMEQEVKAFFGILDDPDAVARAAVSPPSTWKGLPERGVSDVGATLSAETNGVILTPCPNCQAVSPPHARFCGGCGQRLA